MPIYTILSACKSPNDVFTLLVGSLTDGWQEGRYQAFVELFKNLYNCRNFETAVVYLPKLQNSFSDPYSEAIVECLSTTVCDNPEFDADHMLGRVADIEFPKRRQLMGKLHALLRCLCMDFSVT